MKTLLFVLLLCSSCYAADFKINRIEVRQVLSDTEAICVRNDELVLISGLDFSRSADGDSSRSNRRGYYDGNYRYVTVLGSSKTIRRITIQR